ncbi:energy-coupling factor transporter transmembrane component T [Tepidanaerobacter syntrophicus]|uniref:energy-coupling factor transporter transmembrane component T n=1 Tax=Tepidanaerobacter syntrophicus TaxID=224999 RepID=UPI001BD34C06|nr:energy-coupling factor transporter transmembrane component T [Tepidanaerobacter syntrophicus]
MTDAFSTYHPVVNFLYFTLVLVFSMFFMHPICLGISLLCAFIYSVYLKGKNVVSFSFKYMLPMLIATAIINPAFNHEGGTIITYLRDGNPLTLESIAYGIAAAAMLITVIFWFSCYNAVMTSDKFVYLFGRIIPSLSLILSMTLRFIPRFTAQIKIVSNAQKCVGRDVSNGSLLQRVKHGVKILSIMVTWSLENAIETADSMRSRGYGLPGRTAFSIYRFDKRDKSAIIFLLFCGGYIMLGSMLGGLYYRYFPTMKGVGLELYPVSLYLCYFLLCIMPVVINIREDHKWKAIQSKI